MLAWPNEFPLVGQLLRTLLDDHRHWSVVRRDRFVDYHCLDHTELPGWAEQDVVDLFGQLGRRVCVQTLVGSGGKRSGVVVWTACGR